LANGDLMVFLSAFNIKPGVSFLGTSKSKAHCFTLAKKHYPAFINHFRLSNDSKYADIILIIHDEPYKARLRYVNLDLSKPRESTKKRTWKASIKIQFDWKIYTSTKIAINNLCKESVRKLDVGITKIDQRVRFEHIGENKFYLSI